MKTAQRQQFLFNFSLAPLAEVVPWGEPGAASLHWFGLTQGQYWIAADQDLLLEYSAEEVVRSGLPRFCDYYIVRLHEDLMDMLPSILEPVPGELAPWLQRTGRDALYAWEPEAEEDWHTRDLALSWISERTLDLGYLSPAADIRLWSDLTFVHIAWDNRGFVSGEALAWSALVGSIALERSMFEAQVRSFHARFMQKMAERVEAVLGGALDPVIAIDLHQLAREQERRERALEEARARLSLSTDWARIRQAVSTAQARRGQVSADPRA
jgi:hypothetical protein